MKNKKGFTLVELLAVIVIIGLIAGLVLPNVVSLGNDYKEAGGGIFDEIVLNAAKMYVRGSETEKEAIKNSGKKSITYTTLSEKGYLNAQSIRSIKSGQNINFDASYVCVKYDNGTYLYSIGACN